MRIPGECWFSHRSVTKQSAVAHVLREDAVASDMIANDQSWAVIIGMEFERYNPYSFWKPYLHFMRRQEATVWWTDEQLESLQVLWEST